MGFHHSRMEVFVVSEQLQVFGIVLKVSLRRGNIFIWTVHFTHRDEVKALDYRRGKAWQKKTKN